MHDWNQRFSPKALKVNAFVSGGLVLAAVSQFGRGHIRSGVVSSVLGLILFLLAFFSKPKLEEAEPGAESAPPTVSPAGTQRILPQLSDGLIRFVIRFAFIVLLFYAFGAYIGLVRRKDFERDANSICELAKPGAVLDRVTLEAQANELGFSTNVVEARKETDDSTVFFMKPIFSFYRTSCFIRYRNAIITKASVWTSD